MTVPSTTNRFSYNGSGNTGPFTIGFTILDESEISVVKVVVATGVETPLTLNAGSNGYTVNAALTSITTTENVAVGEKLVGVRNVPLTQEIDFISNDAFPSERNEEGLDRSVMIAQQQQEQLARAIKLPISSALTEVEIEDLVANSVLVVNATADGIDMGPTTTAIEDAEDNATAAAASAAAALVSEGNADASEAAAAASAAAAAAAVASALWRDVVFVSADTTIDQTYNGKLVRVNTSGGAKTITLPAIAGIATPFAVGIEKQTSDGNAVSVVRSSTDTIDGATSKSLATQGSGATFVADVDPAPDEWSALEFGPVDLTLYAPLASPTFTGTPAAPTAAALTNTTQLATTAFVQTARALSGHITGLLPSSIAGNATTASLSVSVGEATDSTGAVILKRTSVAGWNVTNGNSINGYEGGTTLPNNNTIYFYVCQGTTGTGIFASASLTPTLPSGYNTYYRRIFVIRTDGSGAPIPYTATEISGGGYRAEITTLTGQTAALTTSATSVTILTLPAGIRLNVFFRTSAGTNPSYAIWSSLNATDVAPNVSGNAPGASADNAGTQGITGIQIMTNTSAQIRGRASTSGNFYIYIDWWEDFRRA